MTHAKLAIVGLGSRTTLFYVSELNRLYNIEKGGFNTYPFLLLNTNFNDINSLLPKISKKLDTVVNDYIKELETLNTTHLLIPNITLHETIDRLKITKDVLHPLHLSIEKIKKNNWNKVVVFGSYFSMNASYIKNKFSENGIKVLLPTQEDMLFIDTVRKQIYNKTETIEIIEKYHQIINKYLSHIPVILACTELSILKPKDHKNLVDMAQVQIEEAVKLILK